MLLALYSVADVEDTCPFPSTTDINTRKIGGFLVVVFSHDCTPESIDKREWPYNAVLVTYEIDGVVKHDHAAGPKNSKIFDAYYDLLKPLGGKILTMETMYGMVNPKLWGNKPKNKK